jgi:Tannase and feruloyl esterase
MIDARRSASIRTALAVGALGVAIVIVSSSKAAVAAETAPIKPIMACSALGQIDLSPLDTSLTSTTDVTRSGLKFCDVRGYISPVTQFEALLPSDNWRGDYLQQGCGGFCGHSDVSLDDPSRTSGYQAPYQPLASGEMVVAADDQGHETATNSDGLWGKHDLRLRAVLGYGSEHQLAQTMKALIHTFYGRAPSYSYFSGVSDGGHEALVLAQRYPWDFDGILVGAPAANFAPLLGLVTTWGSSINRDADGKQILTAEKLPALHAAVLAACADKNGVIEDPRACSFDPASIRCSNGSDASNCLTDDQVQVVREEYRGPTDKEGHGLFDGGEPYGSELAWAAWLVQPAADTNAPSDTYAALLGINHLNNLAFWPNTRATYTLGSVPFTVALHDQLQELGGIYNATDPDLSLFRARGGKILMYQGWADQAIPPFALIDYYRAFVAQSGGFKAARSFSRLYMIPGLYHCPCGQPVDGDPATRVQFMPELVTWVEQGKEPDSIAVPVTSQTTGAHLNEITVDPFDPTKPDPQSDGLNSHYNYIGLEATYSSGNALWCADHGQAVLCTKQ